MPTMLAKRAISVPAFSAFMSVAMSSPVHTLAKDSRLSLAIPSCAPRASTLRMVAASTGWVLESSRALWARSSSSRPARFDVLRTFASAVSNSSAWSTQYPPTSAIGLVTFLVRESPRSATFLELS